MGMGNAQGGSQVYFDPQTNQYYTQNNSYNNGTNAQHPLLRGSYGNQKNYLSGFNPQPAQKSPINELLAQSLAAKPNAPGLAQLFSGMSAPNMGGGQGMPIGLLGQGQYGAGRFLGNNVMGNPSLTSTAMNT